MPLVRFTAHLKRWAPDGLVEVPGETVRAALDAVFATSPALGPYVLDDQKRLRKHVALFVDGEKAGLETRVGDRAEIAVLQALTGG
jgi:molybdopterin converting factor small subunit